MVKELKLCDRCVESIRVGYGLTSGFQMEKKYNVYDIEKCAFCGKKQRGLNVWVVKIGNDK